MPRTLRSSTKNATEAKENVLKAEVTPKKAIQRQKRKSPNASSEESSSPKSCRSNSLSPLAGRFANKLNIAEQRMGSVRCALAGNKDLRLPGREKEYDELTNYFTDLIDTKGSGSLYISGMPGTGKTATLMKIAKTSHLKSKLKIAFINCTSVTSIGAIYQKICKDLKLSTDGVREKDCLAAIESYLQKTHKTTLLVLDEIDQLCTLGKKQDVLYHIFEWPSILNSKLILVGIANSLDLTDRLLDRLQTKCELKPRVMHFSAYTKSQIIEIFKSRLEESGVSDLFPPAALQLLAAKVSSVSGDIRRALNIGKHVIEMAEMEKKRNSKAIDMTKVEALIEQTSNEQPVEDNKKIEMKNVVSVLNKVYGNVQKLGDNDDGLTVQQKILICTLLLIIKNDKNKIITVGRLHDIYRKVCRNRNIESTDLTEFLNICILTETRGILKIVKKKEPRFQQVQLQWDENEVFSALKDKQMITNILNEKYLLSH